MSKKIKPLDKSITEIVCGRSPGAVGAGKIPDNAHTAFTPEVNDDWTTGTMTPEEAETMLLPKIHKAGIPKRFRRGFAAYDAFLRPECEAVLKSAKDWAEAFDRDVSKGLVATGVVGCGKTMVTAGIARRLIARGFTVEWKNIPRLFFDLSSTWSKKGGEDERDIVDPLVSADVLVLDELGIGCPKEWELERLYMIVNERYDKGKPILLTSNYGSDGIKERLTSGKGDYAIRADTVERIVSRLFSMVEALGQFPDEDLRRGDVVYENSN